KTNQLESLRRADLNRRCQDLWIVSKERHHRRGIRCGSCYLPPQPRKNHQRRKPSHARRLQRLRRPQSAWRYRNRPLSGQSDRREWHVYRQSRRRTIFEAWNVRLKRDFIELDRDISKSPLWNHDLAPTSIEQRTWSTWNIAALWIGMSVVITTYTLAGGFIEAGMNWWQAMMTILLGNTIVLIPMVLNAHAGTKYGISFPVLCRASFGTKGANIPAILRAIVACGWFGIQTWIGGAALDALFGVMWKGWSGVPLHTWIAFFLFWGIQVYIIVHGVEGIKHL